MNARLPALALVTVSLLAAPASAQPGPRELGIFGDPDGTVFEGPIEAFEPFTLHIVGFDLDGGILGWEALLSSSVGFFDPERNPEGITILGRRVSGPAPLCKRSSPNSFICGLGGCLDGGGTIVLAEVTLGFFGGPEVPQDLQLCLEPSVPSSFDSLTPGYLQCDGTTLVPLGPPSHDPCQRGEGVFACFIGNPSLPCGTVASLRESWGDLKTRF